MFGKSEQAMGAYIFTWDRLLGGGHTLEIKTSDSCPPFLEHQSRPEASPPPRASSSCRLQREQTRASHLPYRDRGLSATCRVVFAKEVVRLSAGGSMGGVEATRDRAHVADLMCYSSKSLTN